MGITIGTNSGFVLVRPTDDPEELRNTLDDYAWAYKQTAPAGAINVSEIGWWCDPDSTAQDVTIEVGLYTHDSGTDRPATLLGKAVFAKGATVGVWKYGAVDIDIAAGTIYWIAIQIDNTAGATYCDYTTVTGAGQMGSYDSGSTTLPNTWIHDAYDNNIKMAIYAVYSIAAGTNMQANVGDVWKDIDSIQINIGDVWKDVTGVQINVGDAWKTVF